MEVLIQQTKIAELNGLIGKDGKGIYTFDPPGTTGRVVYLLLKDTLTVTG